MPSRSVKLLLDCAERCSGRLPRCRWTHAPSKLACGPFVDSGLHLLVRDKSAFLDVALCLAHCSQKRDLLGNVTIIDVIGKPVNGLKNLILDAHVQNLAKSGFPGKQER